jgi:hypothetical protein
MNTEAFDLFPTLVTKTSNFLSAKQCGDIFNFLKNNKILLAEHNSLSEGGKSSFDGVFGTGIINLIEKNVVGCESINEKLNECLFNYSKQSGVNIYYAQRSSWFNIQDKNSYMKKHSHILCSVGGALYINVDENSSGIYFYNPNPFLTITNYKQNTPYTYEWYKFIPKNGDLIIFPSWLSHGSNDERNQTEERTVISFNN